MKVRHLVSALLVSVALVATGCTADNSGEAQPRKPSAKDGASVTADGELAWGACENRLARAAKLECSRLAVPLDPDKPKDKSIELVLARQKATGDADKRIGSLVMNPGGPGASGVEFLAGASLALPESLKNRFDLVSFDPRGVGESTPVRCLSDSEKAKELEGDLVPTNDAEVKEALKEQKQNLESCEKNSGELITHMSTADVAADLDRIREALGDDQLTYMGFSYGTAIGAVYATLFPKNTRALVLDGSVNPVESPSEEALTQAGAFEQVLDEFETACDQSKSCPLAPDAERRIENVRKTLLKSPIDVETKSGKRTMGADQFDLGLAMGLYDPSLWGVLANSIADLKGGGAALLFSLMDRQTGRKPDGSFDNSADANVMVNCADAEVRLDKDAAVALADEVAEAAPIFGAVIGWSSLNCLDWPKASNPTPKISGEGAPPILIIGTLGDPATPYAWSEAMASALQDSVLLTYEGSGHTAFMSGGPCVQDAAVNYLLTLELPTAGATCPAVADAVSFEPLSKQIVSQMVQMGLPEDVADCIVDAAIAEVGEPEFNRMVIGDDSETLPQLISAKTLSCIRPKGGK